MARADHLAYLYRPGLARLRSMTAASMMTPSIQPIPPGPARFFRPSSKYSPLPPLCVRSEAPTERNGDAGVVRLLSIRRRAVITVEGVKTPVEILDDLLLVRCREIEADARSTGHVVVRHQRAGEVRVVAAYREPVHLHAQ